jgi:hypothetical protein
MVDMLGVNMKRHKLLKIFLFCLLPVLYCGPSLQALAQDASFAATLDAPNGGSAHGTGSFTFDGLGGQLTYMVFYDHLSGTPTEIHFSGPVQSNVDHAIMARANPIRGTVSLTDAEVGLLKGGNLFVAVRTAGHPEGEISGRIDAK